MAQDSPFTEEELAYMLAHENETRVTDVIACVVVCGVATTVFLALRLYARTDARRCWRLDLSDWLMVFAWASFQVYNFFFGLTTRFGGGRHAIYVSDNRMLQICSLCGEVLYHWAMGGIKLSLLALYGAIFPLRTFRYSLWLIASFTLAWVLMATFAGIFQCVPIKYGWDRTIPGGYCIQYGVVTLVATIANVITDFILLFLPVKPVLALQMNPRKKKLVILVFSMGSRIVTNNGSYDIIPAVLVSSVELTMGLLVASLPTYTHLYQRLFNSSKAKSTTTGTNYHPHCDPQSVKASEYTSTSAGTPVMGYGINVTSEFHYSAHYNHDKQPKARSFDEDAILLHDMSRDARAT
ncbi:hypothetical protein DL770_010818 [Monosporascus sp. CRB-9-2]|nr:hypothetical protein DL770_010818 [Monosporascus sp. CRB-9-2]